MLTVASVLRPARARRIVPLLLATALSAAGCRYGYDLLPPLSDSGGAAGATPDGSAGTGATEGGASSGVAGTSISAGTSSEAAGADGNSSGEGGGTSVAGSAAAGGSSASSGSGGTSGSGGSSPSAGSGGSGSGTPPDMALCNQGTYGPHDYLLCQELRSWDDASSGCGAVGMQLAHVDDTGENQWLLTNANLPGGMVTAAWLGASDRATEGEWRWNDGQLFWLGDNLGAPQNGAFAAWYFREPNDVNADEDCATLETKAGKAEWYDRQCALALPYICESL